jgi:hypothetical protein
MGNHREARRWGTMGRLADGEPWGRLADGRTMERLADGRTMGEASPQPDTTFP